MITRVQRRPSERPGTGRAGVCRAVVQLPVRVLLGALDLADGRPER